MAVSSLPGACLAPDHRAQEAPTVAMPTDFDTLYSAHAKFVWRAALRLGVEPMAVEDVVQEIFLVVHRGLDHFERRSSARTWIYGIAVNVVRHHRRARARKSQSAHECSEPIELGAFPADPAQAPDAILEKAQAARLLLRVLDNLSSDLREVFVLAELEEITLAEIGKILNISSNTVASRLRAARKRFDEALVRERARDGWRVR